MVNMQKFSLDNELNRIQNKQVQQTSTLERVLFSILVLFICATFSLHASYSVDLVEMDGSNTRRIHVEVVNGLKDNYDFAITQPSFKRVIDSNYKNAVLTCNDDNVNYNIQERLLYGNSIEEDVNCTLIFDNNTAKSSINLKELNRVNDNNGISYYYDALAENNYIMVNDMMFRIVRINGDGSLRIMLNDNIGTTTYGDTDYVNSQALAMAREWFNKRFNGLVFIVDGDYDLNSYDSRGESFNSSLMDYNSFYYDTVGFISANELMLINKENKISINSYLYGSYFTSNETELGSVWVVKDDGLISTTTKNNSLGVRPVINVKYSSLSGDGTIGNPYMIEE